MPLTLPQSPENKILAKVVDTIRNDTTLSGYFKPIRLLENPTRQSFVSYAVNSMAVQPFSVVLADHPSKRSTVSFGVMISAFLPNEQTELDSALVGLDLGSYLRSLLWGLAVVSSGVEISFATTSFRALTPLIGANGATRILSYQAIFETDIDPTAGDFTA